jgi:hypothetical protein
VNVVAPSSFVTTFGPPNSAAVSKTVTEASVVDVGATPAKVKLFVAWAEPAGMDAESHETVAVLVPSVLLGSVQV